MGDGIAAGRDLALRMPFLLSAAVWFLLFLYAIPILNARELDEAGAEARRSGLRTL